MSLGDAHDESAFLSDSAVSDAVGAYAVKLPVFEGPLDLLLHLIRQNEVEITEIPIARVCEQYLAYLELMQELNLDVVGEYLVMAATLALIKSRMLLPPEGDAEEEDLGDPRAELVARLLEYQRFKEVSDELAKRRRLGRDVFEAVGPGPERIPDAEREIEIGLFELLACFRDVLENAPLTRAHEVVSETITVRERMIAVMDLIAAVESIEFARIFDAARPSRALLVATFLAILELTRLSALRIYQGVNEEGAPMGPIRLRASNDPESGSWTEKTSDRM